MPYMQEMFDDARQYIQHQIASYQKYYMDEIACILAIDDKTYTQWFMEISDREDEMMDYLDEEQEDEFLPIQEKIDKELDATFLEFVVRSPQEYTR